MKNEQTAVIKDMEFLLNELHKEWERPGEVKSSVSIPYEKVEEISRKLNVIVYETQQSADSDGLAFKQSIAKSKQCYVLLRIMRKIVKGKGKCDRQVVDAEFVIELDGEESKLFKEMFAVDCQHFFRQIFLGYFSDIVQAFDTLRKNVCGDDYTSLHNPIVLSSVLPAYGMFHSIQILFL